MAFVSMTTTQKFLVTAHAVDKNGNPAQVQAGSTTFVSSDPAVATVQAESDNTAFVVAVGTGTYAITATADADLGEGVVTIEGSDSGEVIAAPATALNLVAGPVQDQ